MKKTGDADFAARNTATARRLLNIACPAPAKLLTKANGHSYYYFYPIKKRLTLILCAI